MKKFLRELQKQINVYFLACGKFSVQFQLALLFFHFFPINGTQIGIIIILHIVEYNNNKHL